MSDRVYAYAGRTTAQPQNANGVLMEGLGTMPDLGAPLNLVAKDSQLITPQMLTLVDLTQEQIDAVVATVPGGARNVQEMYPLTPLQEGMLFHHLLDQRSETYVLSTLLQIRAHAHVVELINGLQKTIDRHDALRTAIAWEGVTTPVQVVYRQATLRTHELLLNRDGDPIEQLKERVKASGDRLELRQAPLMRLWTAADPHSERWYALLQRHHIVFDHQSWNIVFSEALAHVQGRECELPAPPAYRNYVAWSLTNTTTQDSEAFFRRKLAHVDGPAAPFGLTDASAGSAELVEARVSLEPELAERLRTQARSLGVGASRLFHAVWALVIAGTSGRDDVVFGTVVLGAHRRTEHLRRMVGLFINTLPLRLRIQDVTAQELVERTHRELKALLDYQQTSPVLIQRAAGVGGGASLFAAVLNYRHSEGHSVVDPKAAATDFKVLASGYHTNYPVMLVVDDFRDGFTLTVQTDRRVDPSQIAAYTLTALNSLLEALAHAPHAPAGALSILPATEWRRLTEEFNATQTAAPQRECMHELFEAQVERTPDAIAVTHETRSLTYAELNARANRLARYLRAQGVGPDRLVAICLERGVEMVVGLLGILKAGAAYVPFDPNYPKTRLQYMLDDARPLIVLTQESLRGLVLEDEVSEGAPRENPGARRSANAKLLFLDSMWGSVENYPENNLPMTEVALTARDLVYVIYTSGSTGRPKGTSMAHGSMVNLIEWHRRHLPLGTGHRVLQFAALSFDVAFQETFTTLCTGGTLVMLAEEIRRDVGALADFMSKQSIQRVFVPPLMLQSLAEFFKGRSAASLQCLQDVITAGEQLRISPEVTNLFEQLRGCRLHNHYGPTETHVVTAHTLTGEPRTWPALPAIGQPVSNTQMYVLNGSMQPVPIGAVGEICIGGTNVARGYANRPQLTAQRFVVDSFTNEPGARFYRTGDIGRWRHDGTLDYLGRKDDQVKIRGYRIELGEIEAQLLQHEQIKDAAVVAHEDAVAGKRLVAYITQRDGGGLNAEKLQQDLGAELPEYMVPRIFVTLPSMPLTPNGKLDRRALPAPDFGAYAKEYEPPQGDIEEALAKIWRELLGLVKVGRRDNFFDVGGHSLLATRVMTHISQRLDVDLPLRVLFERPTIEELSEYVLEEISAEMSMEVL